MSSSSKEIFVSLVFPIIGTQQISTLLRELGEVQKYLEAKYSDYEIVIVNSNSNDLEQQKLKTALKQFPFVHYIQLIHSANFYQTALVGLENSIGDVIFVIDHILSDLKALDQSVDLIQSGADLVMGENTKSLSLKESLKSKGLNALYRKVISYSLPAKGTDFRAISRSLLTTVLYGKPKSTQIYHRLFMNAQSKKVLSISYKFDALKTTLGREYHLKNVVPSLLYNSINPLRIVSILGLTGGFLGICISGYALLSKLLRNDVVSGWTTLSLFISIQFVFLFMICFVFGEYLARFFDGSVEADEMAIKYDLHSSVFVKDDRINVTEDAQAS